MSIITTLIQFVSNTKALAGEVNSNFENVRIAHNDLEVKAFKKDGSVAATGNFSMGGKLISNTKDPELGQDVATKNYADLKALLAGDDTQLFSAADGSDGKHVVNISQFSNSLSSNGYAKLPSGLILQWGSLSTSSGSTVVNLPVSFNNSVYIIIPFLNTYSTAAVVPTSITLTQWTLQTNAVGTSDWYWIAIGK